MTCREKLKMEHPEDVDEKWGGGCYSCPDVDTRRYIATDQTACHGDRVTISDQETCRKCWDTEIPNTEPTTQEPETAPSESTTPIEQKSSIPSMTDLQWLMRKALGYPGIAVSITFMEDAITFNAYPYPTQEEETNESR